MQGLHEQAELPTTSTSGERKGDGPSAAFAIPPAADMEISGLTTRDPIPGNVENDWRELLIHQRFECEVERHPEAVAAVWNGTELTYAELNHRANQVAHALSAVASRPDEKIGLYMERSMDSVIGMLAILKAGAAYVPLDPNYPDNRIDFMFKDSDLVAVLTTASLAHRISRYCQSVILLEDARTQSTTNLATSGRRPHDLAYVVYTSGSTGRPKGVMVEHRNVIGLALNGFIPIGVDDCVVHCASTSFDATTWEVWAPLLNGARVLIVPQHLVLSPTAFDRLLTEHRATAMFLTVGLFNQYVDSLETAFAHLRYLLTGGDALVPSIVGKALGKARPPQYLLNAYGPTETTTFATTYVVENVSEDARSVPIGKPLANYSVYILNDSGEPVSPGEPGEIHIGGSGVARGYLNQEELTRERFLTFCLPGYSGTLYRTGDLGRWRDDGNIEFLGRRDSQVKIRGFRVELGEVETALLSHPGIRQAVAVAWEQSTGSKRLVAYVVTHRQESEQSGLEDAGRPAEATRAGGMLNQQLRDYLKDRLPSFMIPSIIVTLDAFPLTPNGKLDRSALPTPDFALHAGEEDLAASTPIEDAVRAIWSETLRLERVCLDDNFFELGGDSLLGIETMDRIAESLHTDLHFMALFEYPTVRQLAQFVEESLARGAASTAAPNAEED